MRRLIWILAIAVGTGIVVYDLGLAWNWWHRTQLHARRGFTSRFYVDADGDEHGYALFVPYGLSADERPALLVFLNGAGENGRDGVLQISNNFGEPIWEMKRRFPLICLAPQCRDHWGVGSPDTQAALSILDAVMAEYNVDPARVYLTGVSAGARAVWETAAAYPEKFAALVPISGTSSLSLDDVKKSLAANNVAIWNFYNDADSASLVADNRAFRERLFEAGLSPIFTEYHQGGHDAWTAGYRTAAMYEWLSQQDRRHNAEWSGWTPFQRLLADRTRLSEWQTNGSAEWTVSDGVLSCSAGVDDGQRCLVYPAPLYDFELHFDYRGPDDSSCVVVLRSASAVDDAIRIVVDWPERSSGGVLHEPSRTSLGRPDPLAQSELVSGRWNDVRVSRIGSRLRVHVNGALLNDIEDARVAGRRQIGLVASSADTAKCEWRYIRLRQSQVREPHGGGAP